MQTSWEGSTACCLTIPFVACRHVTVFRDARPTGSKTGLYEDSCKVHPLGALVAHSLFNTFYVHAMVEHEV